MRRLYVARRLRFENGERVSATISVETGLPVHAVVLFLNRYRTKGKQANTINSAARSLALLYRHLDEAKIDLLDRLRQGRFLTPAELDRLADVAQYRLGDLDEEPPGRGPVASNVRSLERMRMRRRREKERELVEVATRATRIRHFRDFLTFLGEYYANELPPAQSDVLLVQAKRGAAALSAMVPEVRGRAGLGARAGLDETQQELLLGVVDPNSPSNPWKNPFVRERNFLIVALYLASGVRRGELAGLQVGDLSTTKPRLTVYRRADDPNDKRVHQPVAKTRDREIELDAAIMQRLWQYLALRRAKKPARKLAQVWVTDDGKAALSYDAFGKIFTDVRKACPELPHNLTGHVLRHTWNDRFSAIARKMGLTAAQEEKARATQQGWSPGSQMPAVYTRRTTEATGQQVGLKLQQELESKLNDKK